MEMLFRGVRVKWCYVSTDVGTELVEVVEDSGSSYNWISRAQIERFGLSTKKGRTVTCMTLTGERFTSHRFVEVSWRGKDQFEGKDIFYEAPENSPIDMVVGNGFTTKYSEVFMEQNPSAGSFLTVQSRVTVSCQSSENQVPSGTDSHFASPMNSSRWIIRGRWWRDKSRGLRRGEGAHN